MVSSRHAAKGSSFLCACGGPFACVGPAHYAWHSNAFVPHFPFGPRSGGSYPWHVPHRSFPADLPTSRFQLRSFITSSQSTV